MKKKTNLMRFLVYIIFSHFALNISFAQNVAIVGDQEITVDEFKKLYEFTPHFYDKSMEPDSAKKKFLYSLIAERIWMLYAIESGIDSLSEIRFTLETLMNLYNQDELFKEEIEKKIFINPSEFEREKRKSFFDLEVKTLTSLDSSEIFLVYDKLLAGTDFDSLLNNRNEKKYQIEPIIIKYGSLDEINIENILYSLKVNEFTYPIKSSSGWFIFKLLRKIDSRINDNNYERYENITETIIKKRKADSLTNHYLSNLLGRLKIEADIELYKTLKDNLLIVLKNKVSNDQKIIFNEKDIFKILKNIDEDQLNHKFIFGDKYSSTLRHYLYFLIYNPFILNSTSESDLDIELKTSIRKFIEHTILSYEGKQRGYENNSEVKFLLALWKSNILANYMMNRIIASVNIKDEELQNYFNSRMIDNSNELVNIIEIYNEDLSAFEDAIIELNQRNDFKKIAQKYNNRKTTKFNAGEYGYFNPRASGKLGEIISKMKTGEIFGPFEYDDGYSMIKLIDRKYETDSLKKNIDIDFEDMKEVLQEQLFLIKADEIISDLTIKYADKYKISINEELLKNIKLINLNMFTFKYIGFGGKISAFPLVTPNYDWYDKWHKQKRILP